jgi:hypothetical protein
MIAPKRTVTNGMFFEIGGPEPIENSPSKTNNRTSASVLGIILQGEERFVD